MRTIKALLSVILVVLLFSCKKEQVSNHTPRPTTPPIVAPRHALLKDITIPHLPSPYYHFEYGADSLVTKAHFASGFTIYDIIHKENKLAEMHNNSFVNHDTLRYFYDSGNKVSLIQFINEAHIIYRQVLFTYQGDQVKEIRWEQKEASGEFLVVRILTFTFYPDGNVKSIQEQRRPNVGEPWRITIKAFEQYDNGINVDDFGLIHDGIHDHLFLLQGFRLQKNNPRKETLSVNGVTRYSIDYSYVYNSDHTPSTKTGNLLFQSGSDAGKRFTTNAIYTYY